MSVRRSRDRRTTSLDQLAARVDALAGNKKCIAIYLHDENGEPSMVLMADACPVCREFRASMAKKAAKRGAARPKSPTPMPRVPDDEFERGA
jgi:hypothetical protein